MKETLIQEIFGREKNVGLGKEYNASKKNDERI